MFVGSNFWQLLRFFPPSAKSVSGKNKFRKYFVPKSLLYWRNYTYNPHAIQYLKYN